ncbi:hypothetical protein [Sphingobium vermicomposti]|uniref:Alg9-like mannosyltransferase family protein n=1 Tax=Sphingobium vermicomposti TaxID=529005 RepID=A0A846MBY3_9SPHN|nr:hypothetical protein [Sphingobium vermicomposti]NIJ15295.1 hypothetical protein [Sphingobium vermicomposti]
MTSRTQIWLLLLLAFSVRVAALLPFSMHHPDEIFQYLEQSHRLIFEYGTVPWEYRYGMRSWLIPLLASPLMALGYFLAPSTILYAKLPALLPIASGLSITWAAWAFGRRMGPLQGLIAGFVAAIWFEQIFFSVHLLTEVLATGCILPAAVLLTDRDVSRRQWLLAGFLLGLAFILRFQYAPAIALLLLISSVGYVRRCWMPIAAGGLTALILSMGVDLTMGEVPFSWIIENIQQNLVFNRSDNYGVDPPAAYFSMIWQYWRWAAVPIFLLMLPAIEKNRAIFYTALINILIHMAIGHKEYRFIFLSVTILVILAAMGTAELAARYAVDRKLVKLALLLSFLGSSVSLALAEPMLSRWTAFGSGMELARRYGASPRSCGLALHRINFWQTGGYSYLHRDVPTYLTGWSDNDRMSLRDFRNAAGAFNAVIAPQGAIPNGLGFRRSECAGSEAGENMADARLCLYVRLGGCEPRAAKNWAVQNVLLRHDQ